MENNYLINFLSFFVIQCLFLSLVKGFKTPPAPALYTFGDSIVDIGNNNYLKKGAVVNFPPYGIDFPSGIATGRFTNGYTVPDFFDKWLHLRLAQPYFTTSETLKRKLFKGFNYASGSAGILPETGRVMGKNLDLKKQVKLFEESIDKYVKFHFNKSSDLKKYLAESIFVINVGSNDYLNNYIQRQYYNSSKLYNVEQFADLLVKKLGQNLKDLYKVGARKFVVFQIGQIGCIPAIVNTFKPETRCVEHINHMASIFNKKLQVELDDLPFRIPGSIFVTARVYDLADKIFKHPHHYGINETRKPCCASENGECTKNTVPCKDRDSHFFWDHAHPSQAIYKIVAKECFFGEGVCTPINVLDLANFKWTKYD